MASFVNRLKTIIGSDANLFSAISRVLFYLVVSNPFSKIAKKISRKFIPTPQRSFSQTVLSAGEKQNILGLVKTASVKPVFHIATPDRQLTLSNEGEFQIHYYLTVEELKAVSLTDRDYFLILDEDDQISKDLLLCIAGKIITTGATCICFGVEGSGMKEETDQFGWFPHELMQYNYLLNGVVFSGTYIHQIIAHPMASLACYPALLGLSQTPVIISDVLIKKQSSHTELELEQTLVKQWLKEAAINAEYTTDKNCLNVQVKEQPLVSIIIPTRNKTQLVKNCIDSILQKTTYSHVEILLIDNRSDDEEFIKLVNRYKSEVDFFRCIRADIEFNFSALINLGSKEAKGDFLLLLNNDTTVITSDWIEKMLGYAQLPNAGAVGCKLLYAGETIQHAGIVVNEELHTYHVHTGLSHNDKRINTVKNFPAVTAAALMTERKKFMEAGGFNEAFAVEYNDIDFCLKLRELGYYNIYLPQVELFHDESSSRRHPFSDRKNYRRYQAESALMRTLWKDKIETLL